MFETTKQMIYLIIDNIVILQVISSLQSVLVHPKWRSTPIAPASTPQRSSCRPWAKGQ